MSSATTDLANFTTSSWFDLVYHTLSLLPTRCQDASRLYDARYVAWIEARMPRELRAERTLPKDAPLLAALIDAAPDAHALHGFVHLHADVDAFLATAALPFADVPWPNRQQQLHAAALAKAMPQDLIELFRIALWAEVRGGYLQLRERFLLPNLLARLQPVQEGLAWAAPSLPGLLTVRWIACQPLRRAGRLLSQGPAPAIAIGVPDADLDVPPLAAVLQGCHEFVLSLVHQQLGPTPGANPRTGTAGHALHVERETLTLCLCARLLQGPEFQAAQLHWLARLFARRPAGHVREWLASGAALPVELRAVYEELAGGIEAERRSAR